MPSLPIELWLQIFRWATLSSLTASFHATTYHPFETFTIEARDDALETKRTLVLVCKQWRRLTMELLYEDIRIPDGEGVFAETMVGNEVAEELPYRRWVRRAHLPYSSSVTVTPKPLFAVELLDRCPQLEVLVRCSPPAKLIDMLRFEFEAGCPSLPSLRRLDWWHNNEAARSGGINSLADVLRAAPNLQYLSIGGDVWLSFLHSPAAELPLLITLRIRRMNVLFVQQVCRWSLPSLTHVILDTVVNVSMMEDFWEKFGEQIRTVELGLSLKYYIYDTLSCILSACPHLEALYYYIHFTSKPQLISNRHESLTTIGLHAHANSFFPTGSTPYWEHVEEHFAVFSKALFPALKRVVLYGNWSPVLEDPRCPALMRHFDDMGCVVEQSGVDML